jgi:ABC-type sulfate/molybdate transport systems ATPase subunit
MSGDTLIELRDVDVAREGTDTVLVRGVNWQLGRGDFWAVGGDQGCGKTALLATIAGLQRAAAGTVLIKGRDLADAPEAEQMDWRRQIGFVFEGTGRLLSHLRVADNIALPLQYHLNMPDEEAQTQVAALLNRAGLSAIAHTRPSQLSPRQQQQVSLLRALAVPTEVLFLDNPLSGLGASGLRWWLKFLTELRAERNITVVATCHAHEEWRDLPSRRATLEAGELHIVAGAN